MGTFEVRNKVSRNSSFPIGDVYLMTEIYLNTEHSLALYELYEARKYYDGTLQAMINEANATLRVERARRMIIERLVYT